MSICYVAFGIQHLSFYIKTTDHLDTGYVVHWYTLSTYCGAFDIQRLSMLPYDPGSSCHLCSHMTPGRPANSFPDFFLPRSVVFLASPRPRVNPSDSSSPARALITSVPGTTVMTCITVVPGTSVMPYITNVPGTLVIGREQSSVDSKRAQI